MIQVFRAFTSRNYRLYFSGQSLSLIGTWMQRTAVYWLIYEKTGSSFMLGVAVFAAQFPSFLFSIIGGVVSDRYDRFRVLMITQIASLAQAIALTLIVATNQYEVWHILFLTITLGVINAFDVPARQALVYDMVDQKDQLPNAIALNSSMVHAARLMGPALSGLTLEIIGATYCFAFNALSFAAVITSLTMMRLKPFRKPERIHNAMHDLVQGFIYLKKTYEIRNIMIMLALVSLFSLPYVTLLPVFAKEVFVGKASTFGYLNSMVGVGALSGALFLASLKTGSNLKKILLYNTILFAVGLMIFAFTNTFSLALIFLAICGFGMMSQTTISNTLIQTTVTSDMRGRVISFYAMAFFGMQPIGGLIIGAVSSRVGPEFSIFAQGVITLLIAIIFTPYLRSRRLKSTDKMKIDQLKEGAAETT